MNEQAIYYLAQQDASPALLQQGNTQTLKQMPQVISSPGAPPEGPSPYFPLFMFIALFVGMYFLVIRPQRKEDKRKKEMIGALQKGDSVVTSSGILGSVATVKDDTVILKVGDGIRMEFLRSAVAEIRKKGDSSS